MAGIVATFINNLVKDRLPCNTEAVQEALHADRDHLKTATNRLLEELVNSSAMETILNDKNRTIKK